MGYVYVLKLADDNWYVGYTDPSSLKAVFQAVNRQFTTYGAKWTQLHKSLELVTLKKATKGKADWKQKALEMMAKHGWQKVRGYCWTGRVMKYPPKALALMNQINK